MSTPPLTPSQHAETSKSIWQKCLISLLILCAIAGGYFYVTHKKEAHDQKIQQILATSVDRINSDLLSLDMVFAQKPGQPIVALDGKKAVLFMHKIKIVDERSDLLVSLSTLYMTVFFTTPNQHYFVATYSTKTDDDIVTFTRDSVSLISRDDVISSAVVLNKPQVLQWLGAPVEES